MMDHNKFTSIPIWFQSRYMTKFNEVKVLTLYDETLKGVEVKLYKKCVFFCSALL